MSELREPSFCVEPAAPVFALAEPGSKPAGHAPQHAAQATSSDEQRTRGILVDTADIPGGGQLQLVRYDDQFEIMVGEDQLMSSWDSRSEEALASMVCQRLGNSAERVLIGGLGMGFTLASALAGLPASAEIVVAELVPKIVDWAAGPLAPIFGKSLSDARLSLKIKDVHDVLVEEPAGYNAILLDVDNGPDGLVHLANERLYCNWGLRTAYAALRPGGILAVWSAYPDTSFFTRLTDAGFTVEEHTLPSQMSPEDAPHVIWLAAKPA
ncbi:spermidine synthase [Novosphingobium sp. M1R2S20]|uniref:Spermidine synthase n=1 Tax=Novosphingobium rhizovicinum TaxID=3228928 RepID=A0ABV3REL4_9SPHN